MSTPETAMNTLAAQWYNAVIAGCQLSPDQFQLMQGATPVGTTSENLWNIFDSVPPRTATTHYNPSQISSFSQNYAGVISALIPQGMLKFQSDMGDYYSNWNSYKKTINPPPTSNSGWVNAFANWAKVNLPESQVMSCITDYNNMLLDPIAVASNQLIAVDFAPSHAGDYAYTTTIDMLRMALTNGVSKTATLNSSEQSSDISKTWAQIEASGIVDFFSLSGESSYGALTTKITNAGVDITCDFNKVVTLLAGPLKQPSSDTLLSQYTPWFNSGALSEAYAKQDNTVWKAGDSITWQSTFGPSGNLQRYAAALIIVDGINVKMTSSAGLSLQDQENFNVAMNGGFFPFFQAEGSGGWLHSSAFDSNGSITVTSTCPQGNPQVLGVLVGQIANIF